MDLNVGDIVRIRDGVYVEFVPSNPSEIIILDILEVYTEVYWTMCKINVFYIDVSDERKPLTNIIPLFKLIRDDSAIRDQVIDRLISP